MPSHADRGVRRRWARAGRPGSGRVRALLCLGLVAGLAVTTSQAYWTDDVTISGATFTSGVLDLTVNDADPYAGATVLSMTAMVPGNTSAQVLTVKNAGTAPLRYTLTGGLSGTNASAYAAAGALRLTIVLGGTKSGSGNTSTCTGGSVVHGPTALTTTLTTTLITPRPTAGLAASGTENLCFQVTFDASAPSSLQGLTTDAVFTATATSDVS